MSKPFQLTEISQANCPELSQFYYYSPEKYPFLLASTSTQTTFQSSSFNHQEPSAHNKEPSAHNKEQSNHSYDILFIEPEESLYLDASLNLTCPASVTIDSQQTFLEAFDQWFNQEKLSINSDKFINTISSLNPPFTGGWFVFLAYELAQQVEPSLQLPLDHHKLPIAFATRVKKALIFDHAQDKFWFVTENDVDHREAYDAVMNDIQKINTLDHVAGNINLHPFEENELDFLKSVEVIKNYIKDGDVFQVNLSRLWQTNYIEDSHYLIAAKLYHFLRQANPAPFSGVASIEHNDSLATIISSSPERLIKIRDGFVEARPIAGTHRRSQTIQEDLQLIKDLHANSKEQAEHIMLIDLIRNDLGRVCKPGSVKVDELMVNESYAHVHHIVSNVKGKLKDSITPGQAIKAVFPGGTITGCPKVRCMEIIAECEQVPRSAYTGSMGYVNLDGSLDLNILIRSMILEQYSINNQKLSFRAGAGLVSDSIADKELHETRAKAKGLLCALQTESYGAS